MILKIERRNESQKWWILDDIRKVSVSETLSFSREDFKECKCKTEADICILDNFFNSDQEPTDMFLYIRLICRLSNGTEFSVVFDTIAYLCNDSGKTIEKITV